MAAGRIPKPGSAEFAPCVSEDCGHVDCNRTREMAKQVCRYCQQVIGYDRGFYILPSEVPGRGELVHSSCHEDAIEAERGMSDVSAN